jgi:membrane protease YdiL (CAAX protease family)
MPEHPLFPDLPWLVRIAAPPLYLLSAWLAWWAVRALLPPRREWEVPWSGLEVFAALFLSFVCVPVVGSLLIGSGLAQRLYGPEVSAAFNDPQATNTVALMRFRLLETALALPLQIGTVLVLVRAGSGTRPQQLGLTLHQAGRNAQLGILSNVLLGVLGWWILWVPVLALFSVVQRLLSLLDPSSISEHGFTQLAGSGQLTGAEWLLLVFLAVAAAPLLEELLFRGVLQPWLARRRWGGHVGLAAALVLALLLRTDQFTAAWRATRCGWDWLPWLRALAPFLFVLATVPGYLAVQARQRTPFGTACYSTALLFATMHANAWPSPVALFVLALGLGWLAQRTQSLVGPVVLHALFNGIACAQLLTQP